MAIRRLTLGIAAWALLTSAPPAQAAPEATAGAPLPMQLDKISLDELFAQQTTSVAKRPQSVKDAAAAVFVVSREDIRRSGARDIPDVLRMVPGLDVARLPGGEAAVSARGFNSEYGTKLLILLDGEQIYDPTIGTVPWGFELIPLETIERIEVVRGPGATLYGANAVNGVINIISKHPVDTVGQLASIEAYTDGSRRVDVRQGMLLGNGALRMAANLVRAGGWDLTPLGRTRDSAHAKGVSARYDVEPSAVDAFTLQGELTSRRREDATGLVDSRGGSVLGRWTRAPAAGRRTAVQLYVMGSQTSAGGTKFASRKADLDLSEQRAVDGHDLIYGFNYRRYWLKPDTAAPILGLLQFPTIRQTDLGAYLQDEVKLAQDRVVLSLGVKVEKLSGIAWKVQPSVRAIWTDPAGWSAWTAVSQAVRTPSAFETRVTVTSPIANVFPGEAKPEQLTAVEAGWRGPIGARAQLDAAAYYNTYRRLIGLDSQLVPTGLALRPANVASARSYGVELSLVMEPTDWWKLKTAATLHHTDIRADRGSTFSLGAATSDRAPHAQFSIRSEMDLRDDLDFDVWTRRVGAVPAVAPAYTDLGARLAWRPAPTSEIVLKAQNLIDPDRSEFSSLTQIRAIVERRASLTLIWRR
jgi:iron complex outermembrane receptor protein